MTTKGREQPLAVGEDLDEPQAGHVRSGEQALEPAPALDERQRAHVAIAPAV